MDIVRRMDSRAAQRALERLYGERADKQLWRYKALAKKFAERFGREDFKFFSAPGRTEILGNHTDHNHGRDEVRHIGDVFHHRFPPLAANGVQKQSEDDGKREPDDQRIKGKDQGVGKRVSEGVAGEETVEML